MKEKIIRFFAISTSALLLAASVGVIIWITRDEGLRLAARERAAIEAAEKSAAEEQSRTATEGAEDSQDSEKILHDIDTLLNSLSSDDLPDEN